MEVSIVVPVLNEQESLPWLYKNVVTAMEAAGCRFELLLIDDGSTDGSAAILDSMAESDPRVRVVHFRRNFGQTAAMAAGLEFATGDVVVTMDADLQNDAADIPRMLAKLDEGYDLVHGWRRRRQDAFWNRRLPSLLANRLIARVTGFPVRDLGCTLKAMRREVATGLHLYGDMHRFIPILAHRMGAKCVEVETNHHPRQFGVTKYGLSRVIRVFLDLITIKFLIQYAISPMRLFGTIGLSCAGLAGLMGVGVILMKGMAGFDMSGNPLLYVSLFGFMLGLQFLSLGMLGELHTRSYYDSQAHKPYFVRNTVGFPAANASHLHQQGDVEKTSPSRAA